MEIYVSNSTRGPYHFQYRDHLNALKTLRIPSGCQEVIRGLPHNDAANRVVEQLERYGARDAAETYGKLGEFHGLTYRVGALISSDEIKLAHEAVIETAKDRTVTEVTRSALGFDRSARRSSGGRRSIARETEVEVRQELAPFARETGDEVAFKLTVSPEGSESISLPV